MRPTPRYGRVAAVAACLLVLPLGPAAAATHGGIATAGAPRSQDPVGGPQLAGHRPVVQPKPGAAPMPRVHAASWLLADLTTGEVLATKAPHRRLPPASTLKTLTAVTLLPRLDPDKVYRARWSDVSAEGSHVGLVVGGTYTVHDLFNGMLLPSGNDAASALAHANGGWPKTLGQMNAEARRLGAHDTVAKNPSGLDQPGQVSSAYDLALIARAGLARDDFAEYVSTISADFPGQMPKKKGKKRPTYRIYNQNDLLYNGFQGAVGVKTGYTTMAGRTFVGAARRGGHTLVVTLMRTTDSSEAAAAALLNWGFDTIGELEPVGTLVEPAEPEDATPATAAPSDVDVDPAADVDPAVDTRTLAGAVSAGSSQPTVPPLAWALLLVGVVALGVTALRSRAHARARSSGRHAR